MGPAELIQAVTIARQYYLEGKAKTDIAAEFGFSRYKVARILDACLAEGIVRIEISAPSAVDSDLSERLRKTFELNYAVVVTSTAEDVVSLRRDLGDAAAALLTEIVTDDDVLGVSWGRTLDAMARSLKTLAPCKIVQMTGVTGPVHANSVDLIRRLAAVSHGSAYPIYAPLVVSEAATARALHRQPGITAATSQYSSITKAAVAIGSWDPDGSQLYPALQPEDLAMVADTKAEAEVCSILLTGDGTPIDTELNQRTLAITAEQLRHVPEVIAVAGGDSKARAIYSVLRGGLATSVVTDKNAALRLLELAGK
jgi:DNA-binding transcriptional regulator LsrR (DeoR family)